MKEKINHICPKCNQYINNSIQKHINYCDGLGTRRSREKKTHNVWNKGLTIKEYENLKGEEWTIEYSKKISDGLKKLFSDGILTGKASTTEKEIERKLKISQTMKKNPKSGGLRKGAGRGKKGYYKGYWCDSSWELAWVIYQLDHNIKIKRNWEKFEYEYNNHKYFYYPDFIIDDTYYEIKGYMTDKNIEKIRQFKGKLKVIDKDNIKDILKYTIDKYGKNYIELYSEYKNTNVCSICGGYICRQNKTKICINCLKIHKKEKIQHKKAKNKICKCGKKIYKKSNMCLECYNKSDVKLKNDISFRKVKNRPTIQNLTKDIEELGYRGTGRKYGVSDNAIKKWIKNGR